MRSRRRAAIPVLVLALSPGGAYAEERPAGPRIRVTTVAMSKPVVGILVGIDEEALTIRTPDDKGDARMSRASIAQLEVSRRRGNRAQSIVRGVLLGAALGAFLGSISASGTNGYVTEEGAALILASVGAPVGGLVGLGVSHGEAWETTTPDRLQVGILPTRGGVAVRVSFGF